MQEQVDIQKLISSREYSWFDKIRAGDWWNRTQIVKQGVSMYNIVMIINRKSDVKFDESILGKVYNEYIVASFIIITCPTHISRYVSWCTSQHTYVHI